MNIANKDGFRFGEKAYIIGTEFGARCIAYANNEQEALDYAVAANHIVDFVTSGTRENFKSFMEAIA